MRSLIWAYFVLGSGLVPALAAEAILGNWDLQVEPGGAIGWIGVSKDGGVDRVQFLYVAGGVENPPEKAKVEGDKVTFRARDMNWEGRARGDTMTGTATRDDGKVHHFTGKRFAPDVDVSGNWKLEIEGRRGRKPALHIVQNGKEFAGTFKARQELPISNASIADGVFKFGVGAGNNAPNRYEAKVMGDRMEGTALMRGSKHKFTAEREREWSEPVELFDGRNLNGWKPLGDAKDSKWKVIEGIMTNTGPGANIVTDKKFRDFKLHVEFRVPRHGNSGVYLRGRYEVQVEDSYGQKLQGGMCGALYTRITPTENASKPAGEWQTFDVTLIGQYVTVIHNGKKVIDNKEIEGITGGALDVNEHDPGPIYLQGDHGPIEYRKLTIWTPAQTARTARN